jgi:O-antigen ligase
MVFRYLWIIGLLALVVASWSRGAWLAGGLVLLLVAWIRLSKRWIAALVGLGVIAVVIINANAGRDTWNRNPYLYRLITLVRVENLTSKIPERINLYQKAVGMTQEHPFIGHGIGSIYLTSVRYARPGDPWADVPDFAHNVFLQVAAELGVPAAALFAALIGTALWRGYRAARSRCGDRRGKREEERAEVVSESESESEGAKAGQTYGATELRSDGATRSESSKESPEKADTIRTPDFCLLSPQHEMLAVTMALTAYLLTQMTANSLNVYLSNQFFFWFLMAGALCASNGRNPPSPSGLWRTGKAQEAQILKVE